MSERYVLQNSVQVSALLDLIWEVVKDDADFNESLRCASTADGREGRAPDFNGDAVGRAAAL